MKQIFVCAVLISIITSFKPKEKTWVAIGDSITYLNDHINEADNRFTAGYMTRVTRKLRDFKYVNQGHNGWTSIQIAEKIESLGLVKADVYSVFLGTNDWWSGRKLGSIRDYENNSGTATVFGAYRVIINKLRELNPGAKIILVTPMQRVDFVFLHDMDNNAYGSYKQKDGQSLEQFADACKLIASKEKLDLIDLYHNSKLGIKRMVKFKQLKDPATGKLRKYKYPDFINIPFNPKTDIYPYPKEAIGLTYDGLHPSDKAYNIIADLFIRKMSSL